MKFRMAENESVFREHNERVQQDMAKLKEMAKEDGQSSFVKDEDKPLHFFCECADETCDKRVVMKPSLYQTIHRNRDRFIIAPGHSVKEIERVVDQQPDYYVVEKKFDSPDPPTEGLKRTPAKFN
jgi:hypothetical protein